MGAKLIGHHTPHRWEDASSLIARARAENLYCLVSRAGVLIVGAMISSVVETETTTGSQKLAVTFDTGQCINITITPTREARELVR